MGLFITIITLVMWIIHFLMYVSLRKKELPQKTMINLAGIYSMLIIVVGSFFLGVVMLGDEILLTLFIFLPMFLFFFVIYMLVYFLLLNILMFAIKV